MYFILDFAVMQHQLIKGISEYFILGRIFNREVTEEFGFNLISHLKSIYIKWSMIQQGET